MEKQTIIRALENPHVAEEALSRREATHRAGLWGAGLALASMPVLLGAFAKRAFAQALPFQIQNALNFALVLEYLESEFYTMGLETSGLIPSEDRAVFEQISKHEDAHVAFLSSVLGAKAARRPQWDFTAGGMFNTFGDYPTFLVLSQGFEDTGVRAYKGQAGNLMSNDTILQAALQIHSVEARHASQLRRMRGLKGWITGDGSTDPDPLRDAGVYAGEGQLMQLGVDVSGLGESAAAASEAFDEPLGVRETLAIAGLFARR